MKVALLVPSFFEFSGIGRVVEQQARGLALNGGKNHAAYLTMKAEK